MKRQKWDGERACTTPATPFVWALFTRIERVEDLPDPEVDASFEAAEAQIGVDGLLSGWGLVAALLREAR